MLNKVSKPPHILTCYAILVMVTIMAGCVPLKSTTDTGDDYAKTKVAVNQDKVYEAGIRSVMMYPVSDNKNSMLDFPVVFLGDQASKPLLLMFDELGNQYRNYYIKILSCNYDWTPSILQELEYLYQFNEWPITEYNLSSGARVPYTHYSINVPPVKLSGNYIVKVYRDHDPDDVVLTRRFVVYENAVSINLDVKFALDPAYRFSHQQVDFSINYPEFDLFNPNQMLKTVIRQNGRWDNAIYNLVPAFVREEDKTLDFHMLNNENIFPGGNEWRGIDARSMRFLGQGVDATAFDNNKAELSLIPDKSRNEKNYSQWIDVNGRFVLENFETRNSTVVPDYQFVTFRYQSPQLPGSVYIFGGITDFVPDSRFKMQYDSANNCYKARVLLKQGYYNYAYGWLKPGSTAIQTGFSEGDYNMTENLYDVLAYFRPIGARYDRCIGYNITDFFGRDNKK